MINKFIITMRQTKYLIGLAIILVILLIFYFLPKKEETSSVGQNQQLKIMENGLKIEDIKTGNGAEAKAGNTITAHYTGTLLDGTKFDSSLDRGQPFSFELGAGRVISGWDQGVLGMKVGGKRKLTIPPDLAYGANGIPGMIPPNAALVFEIELLGVE